MSVKALRSGGGGGPLRTRRRLTRAQRRPQERRNERRGTAWLQRASSRHLQLQQEPEQVQERQAEVHLSRDTSYSGSSSGEETGGAGARPSGARTHYAAGERCVKLLQDGDEASSLAASVVVDGTPPPSPPDGAPSPSPTASSSSPSPPSYPAPVPTFSAPSSKDVLQQRVMLLRRRDGLIDITIRTMKLMRRNQQLQHRLMALQAETRAFVRSVLNNPENRGLHLTSSTAAATSSSSSVSHALSPLSSPAPSSPCLALTLSRP